MKISLIMMYKLCIFNFITPFIFLQATASYAKLTQIICLKQCVTKILYMWILISLFWAGLRSFSFHLKD